MVDGFKRRWRKNLKLMSWRWQLLLDHGNESVESGNESLNLRIHFTFFYDDEPFLLAVVVAPILSLYTLSTLERKKKLRSFLLKKRHCFKRPRSFPMCYKIIIRSKKSSEKYRFFTFLLHHGLFYSRKLSRENKKSTTAAKSLRLRGMW